MNTKLLHTVALLFTAIAPITAQDEFTVSIKELEISGPGVDISLDKFNYSVAHPSMALSGIPLPSLVPENAVATSQSLATTGDLKNILTDMELQAAYFLMRNDTSFVRSHNELLWQTRDTLDQLRDTKITIEQYDVLVGALDSCNNSFETMAELKMQYGLTHKEGFQGELRRDTYHLYDIIHDMTSDSIANRSTNSKIETLLLREQLLEIRKYEKDYIIRVDERYVDYHKRKCDSLKILLTDHSSETAQEAIPLLEIYRTSFENLVAMDQEINHAISVYRNSRFVFEDLIDQL